PRPPARGVADDRRRRLHDVHAPARRARAARRSRQRVEGADRRPAKGSGYRQQSERGQMPSRKTTEAAAKPAAKKTLTRRRTAKKTVPVEWEHIATRAYYIHLEAGGDPNENWLRAERELVAA